MVKRGTIKKISLLIGSISSIWLLSPLRLANPTINQIVALFTFGAVFISFGVACACLQSRQWIRIVSSIPFFLVAAVFLPGLMVSMVAGGPLARYDVLDSADLSHSRIVAYRINGGATTGYAIKVVQEMSVLPGIVLAKDLVTHHPGDTAAIEKAKRNSVFVDIDGKTAEHVVREFVYF
jgi:hypothetical protein